jgi:Spy/CpxP family protein refolding chaperone
MSTNNGLEWLSTRPQTHYGDCWREHHECALKKIEELQEETQNLRDIMEKYDIAVFDDNVFRVTKKK